MIANSRIWFLPLLISVTACGTDPVTPIVSRPATIERSANDGLTDDYVRFVELARKFLRQGEFELAAAYLEVAPVGWRAGIPSYDIWIELAEAKCREGKMVEALAVLADYDMALKVDFGKETCGGEWHSAIRSPPNPKMTMKVFVHLCSPDALPRATDVLSVDLRREHETQYLDLAAESAVLARRCEFISSTR